MANETINWYPGHMKKATRMMEDSLRLVDAVVELRDVGFAYPGSGDGVSHVSLRRTPPRRRSGKKR